ncbi:hypothetical protein [Hymenobacter sp. CRA2]|uniref:hypothetical protein n=1 Tax=Hymenobacter sp. CRA2 TaxID=1955620 RepID=UPI00098FA48E|nr:hypothetical protein [Hymenobacter sp. CRA2]OON68635.1 hypothetical protein B0919_13445 [Hymenobacter sp. CRA2]
MRRLHLLLPAVALMLTAFSCQNADSPAPDCQTPSTIRDLTGLDGCGYVLVLDNGQRLEPHGDVWQAYAKHDGERVTINYEEEPSPSICMVGAGVKLNCIQQQLGRCGTVAPPKSN